MSRQRKNWYRWRALTATLCILFAGPAFPQSLTTLYSFTGSGTDGGSPKSTLVFDPAGNLYGTSSLFAAGGFVFQLAPPGGAGPWTLSVLYSTMSLIDPPSSLIRDSSGNLYGTASGGRLGGKSFDGSVFELSPPGEDQTAWKATVLRSFSESYDLPGSLWRDAAGDLFGLASVGGTAGGGIAYELTPPDTDGWVRTTLANLPAGSSPDSGLVADSSGHLFGTTRGGGAGYGTAFALTLVPGVGWTRSVLHHFGGGTDGATPYGSLVFDTVGNLYGTTSGGAQGGGTVFELSPPAPGASGFAWTETTLYTFGAVSSPKAGCVLDPAGNLFGTTSAGGQGAGTVFELSPPVSGKTWTHTVLYRFTGGSDGGMPEGGLTRDEEGNLYGTTTAGGAGNAGTVFELTP